MTDRTVTHIDCWPDGQGNWFVTTHSRVGTELGQLHEHTHMDLVWQLAREAADRMMVPARLYGHGGDRVFDYRPTRPTQGEQDAD